MLNQIATGYMVSAALQVALQLEIADRLASGPRPVADLAREAGVTEDGLYRVLRALASAGIFEEQPGAADGASRIFGLNVAGRMLCKGPGSMRDMGLFITSPTHFRVYSEMLHSVTTGQPAVAEGDRDAGLRVSSPARTGIFRPLQQRDDRVQRGGRSGGRSKPTTSAASTRSSMWLADTGRC